MTDKQCRLHEAYWSVTVELDGERVLTIEKNCISGLSDIDKHADAVENCAMHLLAFIGRSPAVME